jgi:hypothetical protein
LATFETSDYAQMRRCRMAQLHGAMIEERFDGGAVGNQAGGYVHAIRPDLTCWPLRWTILIEAQPIATHNRALAMAG